VDSTHIQLDRPYADSCAPTCSGRQWTVGTPWVGFGIQPYMLGIVGQFFNQTAIALSMDSQYSGTAALAKSYVVDVANWLVKYGVQPGTRGLWYGVGYGVCAGANPTDPSCNSGNVIAARELNPEVLSTLALAYSFSPSPALFAGVDNLFSAVYAKYPTDPGYDGTYASDMDGWNLQTDNAKWFGFYWGVGRNDAWPSVRQGGLAASQAGTVFVAGDPGRFGKPGQAKVKVTDPTGAVRTVACTTLPCAVPVNRALGNPLMQMLYLSPDGKQLAAGDAAVAPVK
jgi:hypothetical protein